MALGLVGRKCGMTRIFHEDGSAEPVSVVAVELNRVVQVKTSETDGYRAIQVTAGTVKRSRINKSQAGHYGKVAVEAGRGLVEFRLSESDATDYQPGHELSVDMFEEGQFVDVSGVSIGKGFAGTIKRHHMSSHQAL